MKKNKSDISFVKFSSAVLGLIFAGTSLGQIQFVEVGDSSGMLAYETQWGVAAGGAAADFDDDGDIDIFVPTESGIGHQLYRNDGNGNFQEIAQSAGLASLERGRVALWLDYDGDHRLDLLVASDCWSLTGSELADCIAGNSYKLYRQVADAQFVEVTAAAGITEDFLTDSQNHRGGMAAGDLNNDGYLDIVSGLWRGDVQIFLNQGDGTFVDIALDSGIGGEFGHHWMPVIHDFNGDGWMDIFYAIEFIGNELWINQKDNTFINVAASANADNAMNDMGVGLGDYDNDGDMDVYVTNVEFTPFHNVLYRNDSTEAGFQFEEVSEAAGVDAGFFGWGATFFDADNDGDLDLAATNGFTDMVDPSRFFRNDGGTEISFAEVSTSVGFDDDYWGSALMAADFDRDGLLDLFQVCNGTGSLHEPRLRLLSNQSVGVAAQNEYLVVKPRMSGPNHRAIGAVVRAQVGDTSMMRLVSAGISFASQEPAEAVFGLSSASTVDLLTIEWPGGKTSQLRNVAAGQVLTIELLFADSFESGNLAAWTNSQP